MKTPQKSQKASEILPKPSKKPKTPKAPKGPQRPPKAPHVSEVKGDREVLDELLSKFGVHAQNPFQVLSRHLGSGRVGGGGSGVVVDGGGRGLVVVEWWW